MGEDGVVKAVDRGGFVSWTAAGFQLTAVKEVRVGWEMVVPVGARAGIVVVETVEELPQAGSGLEGAVGTVGNFDRRCFNGKWYYWGYSSVWCRISPEG